MSKKTLEKKAAKAKGKTPAAPKTDKPAAYCQTCKSYSRIPHECGHQCKLTGKPTPRKASCSKHGPKN